MTSAVAFERCFGARAEVFASAAGRLEVLGNHTDYNEGYVLSCAVDCRIEIALRRLPGTTCRVISSTMQDGLREFELPALAGRSAGKDWLDYVRGVVAEFQACGHALGAFEALIESSVPRSAGMSSSAALEMACVSGLCELFEIDLKLEQKARIGQACEHKSIGARTGLMDQLTSLASKADHLLMSEYRGLQLSYLPISPDYLFVVVDSGIRHDLSAEYNDRRAQCEQALALLQATDRQITALRDVSLDLLLEHKTRMPATTYRCALHIVMENQRVLQAIDLLASKNMSAFGALLFASHESSRSDFKNSCGELDALIDYAHESGSCLGARLSGGGFGGVSIHLVRRCDAEAYGADVQQRFERDFGRKPWLRVCRSSTGASAQRLDLGEVPRSG